MVWGEGWIGGEIAESAIFSFSNQTQQNKSIRLPNTHGDFNRSSAILGQNFEKKLRKSRYAIEKWRELTNDEKRNEEMTKFEKAIERMSRFERNKTKE